MAHIHAVYASTSGNVEFVVDTVADGWRQAGHVVNTHRAEITPIKIITDNHIFLFATSTWDHGIMNPFFNRLYEEMDQADCSGKSAFFIGCGDFRYEPVLFNHGIQLIFEKWKARGGTQLHHHLKLNDDPMLSKEKLIDPWIGESLEALSKLESGSDT